MTGRWLGGWKGLSKAVRCRQDERSHSGQSHRPECAYSDLRLMLTSRGRLPDSISGILPLCCSHSTTVSGFLGGAVVKNPAASAGDTGDVGLIPGQGDPLE